MRLWNDYTNILQNMHSKTYLKHVHKIYFEECWEPTLEKKHWDVSQIIFLCSTEEKSWVNYFWVNYLCKTLTEIPILQHELFKIDFLNYLWIVDCKQNVAVITSYGKVAALKPCETVEYGAAITDSTFPDSYEIPDLLAWRPVAHRG